MSSSSQVLPTATSIVSEDDATSVQSNASAAAGASSVTSSHHSSSVVILGGGLGSASVSKTLARLLALPANRTCADCRVTLVDSSQVYASYSPPPPPKTIDGRYTQEQEEDVGEQDEESLSLKPYPLRSLSARYSNLELNHSKFAPPGYAPSSIEDTEEEDAIGKALDEETDENEQEKQDEFKQEKHNGNDTEKGTTQTRQVSPDDSGVTSTNMSEVDPAAEAQNSTAIPKRNRFKKSMKVEPAFQVVPRGLGHGVFICALCGAAHKLMTVNHAGATDTSVRSSSGGGGGDSTSSDIDHHAAVAQVFSVKDPTAWNAENVQQLANTGNANTNKRLEAYFVPDSNNNNSDNRRSGMTIRRPKANSSIAQRLMFVTAKYKALAFSLPPISENKTIANDAWINIVQRHLTREWKYWLKPPGDDIIPYPFLCGPISELECVPNHHRSAEMKNRNKKSNDRSAKNKQSASSATQSSSISEGLPNRLVDFFCVISPSSDTLRLDPKFCRENPQTLKSVKSVQELALAPVVTDCYPETNAYDGKMEFPQHVASFVLPEGCKPVSSHPPSPSFFTFVLTCSDGSRLYGGALKLYDKTIDMETIRDAVLNSGYSGINEDNDTSSNTLESHGTDGEEEGDLSKVLPPWLLNLSSEHGVPIIHEEEGEGGFNSSLDDYDDENRLHNYDENNGKKLDDAEESSVVHSDIAYLPKCLVVLSHYPFFDLWRKFLLQIYRIALVEAPLPIERFIANFVKEVPLPPPGKVEVRFGFTSHDMWSIRRPPNNELPLVDFSFRPLFASLSVSTVMVVVACLLEETRVALLSKHYALLTPVAEALCSLLFPFHWQGMYIPIMPYSMLDILDAPVPFLVGLHARYLQETPPERRPPGVVFVDLDEDVVHLGWVDEPGAFLGDGSMTPRRTPALPEKDATKLKNRLAVSAASVYILPESGKAGRITCGNETPLPFTERDSYCHINGSEVPNDVRQLRRRDVFMNVDRAYKENEMYIPIEDFLSGQGVFHEKQRSGASSNTANSRQNKRLRLVRRLVPSPLKSGSYRNIINARINANNQHQHRNSSSFSVVEDDDVSMVSSVPSTSTVQNIDLLDPKEPQGFSVPEIRTAFLKFFVGVLKNYRDFIDEEAKSFDSDLFLASVSPPLSDRSLAYMKGIFETQMFERFMQERIQCRHDPEVLFFDTSIDAKQNRFKKTAPFKNFLNGGKKDTSFLDDKSKQVTEKYTPPPPSNSGLPDDGRIYHYGSFPDLDPKLFGKARSPIVWPEFQTRTTIRSVRRTASDMIRKQQLLVDGLLGSTTNSSTLHIGGNSGRREPNLLDRALYSLCKPFMTERSLSTRERATSPARTHRSSDHGLTTPRTNKSLAIIASVKGGGSRSSPVPPPLITSSFMEELPVEAAQEVILSSRRKVSILVSLFIDMQAQTRGYLVREKGRTDIKEEGDMSNLIDQQRALLYQAKLSKHEPALIAFQGLARRWLMQKELQRKAVAATLIQTLVRCRRCRENFLLLRCSVLELQSKIRMRRTACVYQIFKRILSQAQARYRGYAARTLIRKVLAGRMKSYRRQIFVLWKRSHTSLAYRTKMWMILKKESFIHHNLAEAELRRLWTEHHLIEDPDLDLIKEIANDKVSQLSTKLGIAGNTYESCVNFDKTLEEDHDDDYSNVSSVGSVSMSNKSFLSVSSPTTSDRGAHGVSLILSTERNQVYERLSRTANLSSDQILKHFDTFNIGAKNKKRKKSLAEAVWRNYDQSDASASLMYRLFPELEHSDKLQFVEPSKKGMRRFQFDLKPVEAESSLRAQQTYDQRVRRNVTNVASIALTKIPVLMGTEKRPGKDDIISERKKLAFIAALGFDRWSYCRFRLMQSLVNNKLLGSRYK